MKFIFKQILLTVLLTCFGLSLANADSELKIEISTIVEGMEKWDWTQARTAYVPIKSPFFLTTMSQTAKVGTHAFHDIYLTRSSDFGKTWTEPKVIPSLKRSLQKDGYEVAPGDLCPMWNEATQKVLITGKTFNFAEGKKENFLREKVSYAVIDPHTGQCGPLRTINMPEQDHEGKPILAPNAGCHQRVDLDDGDILLPVRYQKDKNRRIYTTMVVLCKFDGENLEYVKHGTEHTIKTGRGLYEPSVAKFNNEYFLTMRADNGAYVSKSTDGLNYSSQIPWTFDDGQILGSYNTQQHWANIGGKLYLIYTRKGADNDHIMRHRAPLFIAEVDPEKLKVIRSTEQVLVPENHAALGNSGVCFINEKETWLTVGENLYNRGKRKGDINKVLLAKIKSE